jgi:hypothetical protein
LLLDANYDEELVNISEWELNIQKVSFNYTLWDQSDPRQTGRPTCFQSEPVQASREEEGMLGLVEWGKDREETIWALERLCPFISGQVSCLVL